MNGTPQDIAAQMLTGNPNMTGGLLNSDLHETIGEADRLVRNAGGQLCSRQVIASIIVGWAAGNPGHSTHER